MIHRVVAEVVAAWAFVAHTSYWGSSCSVILAGDCPHRVANIASRRETRARKVCLAEARYFFLIDESMIGVKARMSRLGRVRK